MYIQQASPERHSSLLGRKFPSLILRRREHRVPATQSRLRYLHPPEVPVAPTACAPTQTVHHHGPDRGAVRHRQSHRSHRGRRRRGDRRLTWTSPASSARSRRPSVGADVLFLTGAPPLQPRVGGRGILAVAAPAADLWCSTHQMRTARVTNPAEAPHPAEAPRPGGSADAAWWWTRLMTSQWAKATSKQQGNAQCGGLRRQHRAGRTVRAR